MGSGAVLIALVSHFEGHVLCIYNKNKRLDAKLTSYDKLSTLNTESMPQNLQD